MLSALLTACWCHYCLLSTTNCLLRLACTQFCDSCGSIPCAVTNRHLFYDVQHQKLDRMPHPCWLVEQLFILKPSPQTILDFPAPRSPKQQLGLRVILLSMRHHLFSTLDFRYSEFIALVSCCVYAGPIQSSNTNQVGTMLNHTDNAGRCMKRTSERAANQMDVTTSWPFRKS